jgi:hypothetical protein
LEREGGKRCEIGQNIIMEKGESLDKKGARFDNKKRCEFGQSCSAQKRCEIGQKKKKCEIGHQPALIAWRMSSLIFSFILSLTSILHCSLDKQIFLMLGRPSSVTSLPHSDISLGTYDSFGLRPPGRPDFIQVKEMVVVGRGEWGAQNNFIVYPLKIR